MLQYKTMRAPDFTLPDQNGNIHTLSGYKGKWVVVYFYPKDDTPGCTKEACGFRDNSLAFSSLGITVIGISKDTVLSHKKFAEKYNLVFPLLSDESLETIKAYDAWGTKKFLGREYKGILRKTVIIDPAGNIKKVYENVSPKEHAQTILSDLQLLMQQFS